jgi:hypothetical protein
LTPFAASTVARLWQRAPIRRTLEVSEIAARLQQAVQIASASRPATRLVRLLRPRLAPLFPSGLVRLLPAHLTPLLPEALTLATGPSAVRLAKLTVSSLTVSSLTARRSLMTSFQL